MEFARTILNDPFMLAVADVEYDETLKRWSSLRKGVGLPDLLSEVLRRDIESTRL